MVDFLQTLLATVAVGSLYALIALGYTLVYGVLKFINFAHSDIFVLGAWTSFTGGVVLLSGLGVEAQDAPWWAAVVVFLLAVGVCAATGMVIERLAYRPLRKAPRLNVLITAIGVSLLLQNVGQLAFVAVAKDKGGVETLATLPFGATTKSMPLLLPDRELNATTIASGTITGGSKRGVLRLDQRVVLAEDRTYRLDVTREVDGAKKDDRLTIATPAGTYEAGTELATQPRRSPEELKGASYRLVRAPVVPIRLVDVLVVVGSLVLMVGLQLLVFRTKLGMAMRAVSYNVENAALMGINVNGVIAFTFGLGCALAGAAAFLYPMKYPGLNQTASAVWVLLGLKAFVAAVVGGIGNIRGAVLGGFLIAGIEFFGTRYGGQLTESLGLGSSLGTGLRDVYVFAVLIVVLLVRPGGLLGSVAREKV